MRLMLTAAVFSLAATACLAAPPVVTENISGTISGANTIDTNGYFGAAGTDLSGAKLAVYFQYVPKLLGPSTECRNHGCTYNTSVQMPDTQGSLLITVTVNGHRVVYSPSREGAVFFNTQSPFQLTVDSDAFSGAGDGLPGLQFGVQFKSAPVFGHTLSPGDEPVRYAVNSDVIAFYESGSQTPVEQLSYVATSGSK